MKQTFNYNDLDKFVKNAEAWNKFKNMGLPTKKDEKYRYLDFRFLNNFKLQPVNATDNFTADIKSKLINSPEVYNLVFINGKFLKNISDNLKAVYVTEIRSNDSNNRHISKLIYGEQVQEAYGTQNQSLLNINEDSSTGATQQLASEIKFRNMSNNFSLLNSALVNNVYQIDFKESTDKIYVINYFNFNNDNEGSTFTNLSINIKENCKIQIFERLINLNENSLLNHINVNYNLAQGSELTQYLMQESHNLNITNYNFDIAKDAIHNTFLFNSTSKLSRFDFIINLNDKHAKSQIKGIYFADRGQTLDHYILSNHNASQTFSDHDIKGIINEKAKGIFYASTYVPRNCQQIEAHQLNKNLILEASGECYSRPELIIYADDVKCSHGSATGQIDEEALFYMQSRGISLENAKKLILDGIQQEIYDNLDENIVTEFIKNFFLKIRL